MDATRFLIVVADDYGIGPDTSRGILELAARGTVTGAVLLVNSPYAADAVRAWRSSGVPLELGWHPNLTLDRPVAPPGRVPSLIGPDGCLWPLGRFLTRLHTFRVRAAEVEAELRAQYARFVELVGGPPTLVNSHQHCALFGCVGPALERVLAQAPTRPYVRRVRDPWRALWRVPGARLKRLVLSSLGRRQQRRLDRAGYPGNDALAGVTDPRWVADPLYLSRWLAALPGRVVELACHPGHFDATLAGRDCRADDGLQRRRVDEMARLLEPAFAEAVRKAGLTPAPPSALLARRRGLPHAA